MPVSVDSAPPTLPPIPTQSIGYDESQQTSATPTLDVSLERNGNGYHALDGAPSSSVTPPLWTHRLSASFSAVAEQIAAASQALAQVPLSAPASGEPSDDLAAVNARLDAIEKTQESLAAHFEALKGKFNTPTTNGDRNANGDGNADANGDGNTNGDGNASGNVSEELQKKIDDLAASFKLEQSRLYARLVNSNITMKLQKMKIMAPPTASGKPPPNFPGTRGEFEHLTKERYEAILKAYDQSAKGDVDAKREATRVFLGLPA